MTVQSNNQVAITATEIDNDSPIKHGTVTHEYDLPTTIIGQEIYRESAPIHLHEGALINASRNLFYGRLIEATGVSDHEITEQLRKIKKILRKYRRKLYDSVPINISQTVYTNLTQFEVDSFEGNGVVFAGTTIDKTKAMSLKPLILLSEHQESKSRNVGGDIKGKKTDQDQNHCPHKPSKTVLPQSAAETILHLTSALLDTLNNG